MIRKKLHSPYLLISISAVRFAGKITCLLWLGCWLLAACQNKTEIERPRDPWILRSVLDQRSRMITLALYPNVYVAYDLQKCAFYKAWSGGIFLDGAAFNNIKTAQPTSWGHIYLEENPDSSPWSVKSGNELIAGSLKFKGYTVKENQITFQYQLVLPDNQTITIYEQPDFLKADNGKVSFVRNIRTKGVPNGVTVAYRNNLLNANGDSKILNTFDQVATPKRPVQQSKSNRARYWLAKSGCNTCHDENDYEVGPSYVEIAEKYGHDPAAIGKLVEKVFRGGSGVWGDAPMIAHPHLDKEEIREMVKFILSMKPAGSQKQKSKAPALKATKKVARTTNQPGFGAPLEGVHPSYDLVTIRPSGFQPRVGAMDFLPDGELLVATWDSLGAVYLVRGIETGDTSRVKVKRIAIGLAEPLGLKVVDGRIYVLQKQELTQLIDHDGDEIIDEYRSVCNSWGVTQDFHEFAYGLVFHKGYFYINLGLAMRLMSHERQHPDRGSTLKIAPDGSFTKINFGLRQPNGIGVGMEDELFITENQGRWVPACKVIHIQPGVFHGCRLALGDSLPEIEMKPPAVWLPQDEIGNSPSQPIYVPEGPYEGQMLHGEVTHGGIKRVFLEKVNGEYQGCVFRFSQGLEAGVNRLVWGPDKGLYVGGVGMTGNWGWKGKQFGLEKLVYNGKTPFEMLAVRATAKGMEIEFTKALKKGQGENPLDYLVQQWRYEPTATYGGPKLDFLTLPVTQVVIAPDRKKVSLFIDHRKEKHVLYIRLNNKLLSEDGTSLWSGETWYTLNTIPNAGDL